MRLGSASSRSFSGHQSAEIVGITYRQLDYWARTDLVRPALAAARGSGTRRRYSYRDLFQLRTIKAILDTGIPLQEARRAITHFDDWQDGDMTRSNMVIWEGSVTFHRTPHEIADLHCDQSTDLRVLSLAKIKEGLDGRIQSAAGRDWGKRHLFFPTVEQRWAKLVAVAYHEAGHAVAAHVLGEPVASLTIKPNGSTRTLGCVRRPVNETSKADRRLSVACWRRRRHDARNELLVLLAGPVAGWMKCRTTDGRAGDFARASVLLQFLYPELRPNSTAPDGPQSGTGNTEESRKRHQVQAWNECRKLLTRPGVWEWVEAVAEAALTYETLDGDQIDALNPSRQTDDGSEPKDAPPGHPLSPDLAGADRAGADLFGENLTNHNLTGANLAGTNLDMANLRGAYLFGADLTGATLVGGDLTESNLEWTTLKGADLDHAVLRGAELTNANLAGASLANADLSEANLCGANLQDTEIAGASFSAAVANKNTVWPDGFNPAKAGVVIFPY